MLTHKHTFTPFSAITAMLLGFFMLPVDAIGEEQIMAGVAGAVRGEVQVASLAESVGRQVASGDDIFLGDRVQSGVESGMQVLLLDETVFTVGPNSELVIDEFVYDPSTSVGRVAATVLKGAFRFTTGLIGQEDPESVSIGTPLGTIGIRGTIVAGVVSNDQALIVLVGPGDEGATKERVGRIEVSNGQGSVTISRNGYGTVLDRQGGPPSAPVQIPQAAMTQILASVQNSGQSQETEQENQPGDTAPPNNEGEAQEEQSETSENQDGGQGTAAQSEQQGQNENPQTASENQDQPGATQSQPATPSTSQPVRQAAVASPSGTARTPARTSSTTLTSQVSNTPIGTLAGTSLDGALGGSTSTQVALNTSSEAQEAIEEATVSNTVSDGIMTVQDLISITTGSATVNGNGTLSGTGTTGTFNFTGNADFGNQTLQYSLSANWAGTASGSFSVTKGPESYAQIFNTTDTVDMITGNDEPFDSVNDSEGFSGLGAGETATVKIRLRNANGLVLGAIDTEVSINDNGTAVTGSATGTR